MNEALAALRDHSMDVKPSTWPSIEKRAEQDSRDARTPADTYAAIRLAITLIGDPHSFFLTPSQARSSTGSGATTFTAPSGVLIDHRYALFEVPAFEGNAQAIAGYVTGGIRELRRLDATAPCGWIVDLRGNGGGNMWPMLTVLLPLLKGSPVGYVVTNTGHRTAWTIHDGYALNGGNQLVPQHNAYRLKEGTPAVAVLQDQGTGSSGEAVLVAFRGQHNVKTFGLPSAGVPSANTLVTLSDGAQLGITEGRDADRTGHIYPNLTPIQPDVIAQPTGRRQPPGQPYRPSAAPAVTSWLANQPACARA
ncbi:MAG TPA: S41 family peptidase [Mycobacteriales bacterium]|nr:S41 family peptidase [Mycobacteriales bacterium]